MSHTASPEARGRGAARTGGGYSRPARKDHRSNFELYSWFFMRVSGIILLFMAVYHLFWWNIIVGVEHLSADLVRERWANPFWRLDNRRRSTPSRRGAHCCPEVTRLDRLMR